MPPDPRNVANPERAALALTEEGTRLADAATACPTRPGPRCRQHYADDQIATLVSLVAQIKARRTRPRGSGHGKDKGVRASRARQAAPARAVRRVPGRAHDELPETGPVERAVGDEAAAGATVLSAQPAAPPTVHRPGRRLAVRVVDCAPSTGVGLGRA